MDNHGTPEPYELPPVTTGERIGIWIAGTALGAIATAAIVVAMVIGG